MTLKLLGPGLLICKIKSGRSRLGDIYVASQIIL